MRVGSTMFILFNEMRTRVILVERCDFLLKKIRSNFVFEVLSDTEFHAFITLFKKRYLNICSVHLLTMSLKEFADQMRQFA